MNYEMSGGFALIRCNFPTIVKYFITKYNENSFLYIISNARNGVLSRVYIKKINFIGDLYNYQDTLNGVWLETELCTFTEAEEFVSQYIQSQRDNLVYNQIHC